MRARGAIRFGARVAPVLLILALAACARLPTIGGRPLPPAMSGPGETYRDLADIPEAPAVSPLDANQAEIQSLAEERAKTGKAAEDLRRAPFTMPAPATPQSF